MTDEPLPAPHDGERILSVIGGLTQVSGFMGTKQKSCSLVLTDRRMIFAELTKDKIRELAARAREEAKAEGKGLLGRLGAQMRAPSNYCERYWQMSAEAILAEEPGNFAVDRADIKKLRFSLGMVDEQRNTPDRLTIKTSSEKLKFHLSGSMSTVKDAFRTAGYAA